MNFQEAEAEFWYLEYRRRSGTLSEPDYHAALDKLGITDAMGRNWKIEGKTGKWLCYDSGRWVAKMPPHATQQTTIKPKIHHPIVVLKQPTPEALNLFEQALSKWNNADKDKQNDSLRNDVASILRLAIERAQAPFPRAHSLLAIFLEELGKEQDALRHANIALEQNPDEFRAQLVKIDVSQKDVRIKKIGVDDFFADGGTIEETVITSTFKGVTALVQAAIASATQLNLKNELVLLAKIFRNICRLNTDVEEFIYMAEMMILYGDVFKEVPMPGGSPNLYAEIVNSPIGNLDLQGREKDVKNILNLAEGRSLLFKR